MFCTAATPDSSTTSDTHFTQSKFRYKMQMEKPAAHNVFSCMITT